MFQKLSESQLSSRIALNSKFSSLDASLGESVVKEVPPYLSAERAADVLRCTQSQHNIEPVVVLYDLDALDNSFRSVNRGFPNIDGVEFLHCYAIKSCPLSYILHRAISSVAIHNSSFPRSFILFYFPVDFRASV